ncbi:hypothetical protein B0J14DRAFT_212335 [Halenospora varia]|nr:hypothetical protein B0J14DRAFT_212335 [Halenospora varia]
MDDFDPRLDLRIPERIGCDKMVRTGELLGMARDDCGHSVEKFGIFDETTPNEYNFGFYPVSDARGTIEHGIGGLVSGHTNYCKHCDGLCECGGGQTKSSLEAASNSATVAVGDASPMFLEAEFDSSVRKPLGPWGKLGERLRITSIDTVTIIPNVPKVNGQERTVIVEKRWPLQLLDLPVDVLKGIVTEVTDTNDLTALALTHSALHKLAIPQIYSRFDIVWPDAHATTDPRTGVDALTYGLTTLCMGDIQRNHSPTTNFTCTNCGTLNNAECQHGLTSRPIKGQWRLGNQYPTLNVLPALKSLSVLDIDELDYLDEMSVLIAKSKDRLRELRLAVLAGPTTGTRAGEDPYSFLSTFDTTFLIDDSGSMAGRSRREVVQALDTIAPIVTQHDSDGIDVYFMNHKSTNPGAPANGVASGSYTGIKRAETNTEILHRVAPYGGTPTGTRFHNILKPYPPTILS